MIPAAEFAISPAPPALQSRAGYAPMSTLLLLTDGRFPAGAHAHSGGLEAAVALEGIHDVVGLEAFLRGRVATTGAVAAAFAAASCATFGNGHDPTTEGLALSDTIKGAAVRLDAEMEARTPAPALRRASRRLGRQLLRAAGLVWPRRGLDELAATVPVGVHQPVALGAVAAAAGLDPGAAALAAVHDAVVGPATAAVRLLGLDPFAVHAALARLSAQLDAAAAAGAAHAHTNPADLPAWSAPLLDLSAERHATWEVRLFAS